MVKSRILLDFTTRRPRQNENLRLPRISQADLAARLQVAGVILERDSISRIEIGTRFVTDYEVVEIARALDVSIEWLLGQKKDDLNP